MANGIFLEGFKEFNDKLKRLPDYIQRQADGFVEDAAEAWAEYAKLDAPVDFGFLRGNISVVPKTVPMKREIVSAAEYSPYVEWGTGTRVSVPAQLQAYALQFKGVKKVVGRYPNPYFFIQLPRVENQLFTDIKNLLNTSV